MNYLVEAHGLWFEGSSFVLQPVQRVLTILPISFPGQTARVELAFDEDYFNSATRIRRGQLYQKDDSVKHWGPRNVLSPLVDRFSMTRFDANRSFRTAEESVKPGWVAVLGDNNAQSYWTVVFSEKMGLDAHYITLKSKTYFGVLPEVNRSAIPEANRQDILQALDAVVEAAPIQAPQPVIDACRNAACHMISAQFPGSNPDGKKDLGHVIKWLIKAGQIESCAYTASAIPCLLDVASGHLINRLHSRAKANAAAQHGTRPVSRQDANLAVDAIAFLLQDFGWTEAT